MKRTLPKIQSTCLWGNEHPDRWTSWGWRLWVQSTSLGRQAQQSCQGKFSWVPGPTCDKDIGGPEPVSSGKWRCGTGPSKGERKEKPQANLVSFVIFQQWVWVNEKSSWKFPFFLLFFFWLTPDFTLDKGRKKWYNKINGSVTLYDWIFARFQMR